MLWNFRLVMAILLAVVNVLFVTKDGKKIQYPCRRQRRVF